MAERVCPVWVGYLMASSMRKLLQNPHKILSPYIRAGMTVADVGCAMGFFSLPLAEMVGPEGKVICVDLQEKMIRSLKKRAGKADLLDRIEMRCCEADALGVDDLKAKIDFVLAFAVVHEMPDPEGFFTQVYQALKPGGAFLVAEPKGHISLPDFDKNLSKAKAAGFRVAAEPKIRYSLSVLLEKGAG